MKPVALSGLNGDVVDQRFRFPEIKTEFCVNQLRSRHRTGARAGKFVIALSAGRYGSPLRCWPADDLAGFAAPLSLI
jgi:hypothetical protein